MKGIKNECQLMERCDGHGEVLKGGEVCWLSGRCGKVWEDETVDRKCDSHRRDVKVLKRCVS